MNKLKKELIDNTLSRETTSLDDLDNRWVILIGDRLFAPTHATSFFETKEQAWKCWYRQTQWQIKRNYKNDIAQQQGFNNYWEYKGIYPMSNRAVWETFKAQLYEDYGLKIIQWKDAKRDVCC